MAIKHRDIKGAARQFADRINRVLARTVTQTRVVALEVGRRPAPRMQIAFRQNGQPTRARLHTRFGRMGLYFGQVCETVRVDGGLQQLRTINYKYTITEEESPEPIFRWEYVRQPEPTEQWCRHHLQGPVAVRFNQTDLRLNDLHLPTGYVPFEEILRFCIVDLGVAPLSEAWDDILTESYTKFKADFLQ